MSQSEKNRNNKGLVKKNKEVSIFDDLTEINTEEKGETSISVRRNGELIEGDTKLPFYNRFFANRFSDKDKEITVVNRKRTKGYAPTVFAIILFSGLLFTNILCQIKLDKVGNDMASMKGQLETYKELEKEYSQKLTQKDKDVIEEYANYIEDNMGMVKDDIDKVYVAMELEDETVVIEKEQNKNGWTTLLSSMGRFFSDIFG
jgi:hypothetical protein